MKRFGIRMSGCEQEIENLIKSYLNAQLRANFQYLEIGAAGCITLRAVYDIVKENILHSNWKTIGVDIDGGWSLDWESIKKLFNSDELEVWTNRLSGSTSGLLKAQLWIDRNPRELISSYFNNIDICLIDGCHGICCIQDFQTVESKIVSNGLVLFHDAGILEQGTDWQEHCSEFINVRKHLSELGLFDNKYPNWKFEKEILGSRFVGGDGNNIAVFRKCLN